MYLENNTLSTGSISSLDDMSFSPMAHALSKGDSDLSAVANGMFLDAEPGRSSEVNYVNFFHNVPNCSMHRRVVAVAMLVAAASCLNVVHGHTDSLKCVSASFALLYHLHCANGFSAS